MIKLTINGIALSAAQGAALGAGLAATIGGIVVGWKAIQLASHYAQLKIAIANRRMCDKALKAVA